MSKAQSVRNAKYVKAKRVWWPTVKGTLCPVMLAIFNLVRFVDKWPHHIRGRSGELLWATEWFLAVSCEGHRWIEDHKEEARKHGWEAQRGDWGKAGE